MEINENIAGLGKNHDQAARNHDLAKKQSEAQPAAENMDMEPHSINKTGTKEFDPNNPNEQHIHNQAKVYAKQEHEKADNWENTNETGSDSPQF
jgi:hypothetical protein